VSLLFAAFCYFLITRLMFFNILFCIFVFYLVYSAFLYCFVYCFSFCAVSPSYSCASLPTTATGWNPIAVNKYHIMYQLLRTVVNTLPVICERYILNTCNDGQCHCPVCTCWLYRHGALAAASAHSIPGLSTRRHLPHNGIFSFTC
jgi:hypothetical protein